MSQFRVSAFYKFVRVADPQAVQGPLLALAADQGVKGTILLAREGVNGTIAGPPGGVEAVLAHLRSLPDLTDLEVKDSFAETMPFLRLKVRLKAEIVTLGQPQADPTVQVGQYVDAADWNDLIARDDVVVIDTRNDYEVEIGQFAGAIDPKTESFGDFPAWWAENAAAFAGKKVAMYCTGGIRCEKSTSFLKSQGVEDVYHLKGGILKYLEEVPEAESSWEGECFVFDQRVSVGHGLTPGPYGLCYACRRPIDAAAMASADYEKGVSCPACIGSHTAAQVARFRERQKQVELAAKRGKAHIGQAEGKFRLPPR